MVNQIVLVGRLVQNPELKKSENGSDYAHITLAVPRSYKNINGEYDTDFIDFMVWGNPAQNTTEYCKKGDLIGIKGRMQSRKLDDGTNKLEIVGERVTFLTSTKTKEEDVEIEKNI